MDALGKWILAMIIIQQLFNVVQAENSLDPVEVRKQRNAQLERVSPTMNRLQNMELKPSEIVSKNIGEVARSLKQLEEVLDTLSLIGDRHDQAAVLLDIEQDSLSMLAALLVKEGQRVDELKNLNPSTQSKKFNGKTSAINTKSQLRAIEEPTASTSRRLLAPKNHQIKPVLAKVFEGTNRPAKAILKVGGEFSKTVYVGQTFFANEIEYTLVSVNTVGENQRVPGRKIYQIVLRDPQGLNKKLIWD